MSSKLMLATLVLAAVAAGITSSRGQQPPALMARAAKASPRTIREMLRFMVGVSGGEDAGIRAR